MAFIRTTTVSMEDFERLAFSDYEEGVPRIVHAWPRFEPVDRSDRVNVHVTYSCLGHCFGMLTEVTYRTSFGIQNDRFRGMMNLWIGNEDGKVVLAGENLNGQRVLIPDNVLQAVLEPILRGHDFEVILGNVDVRE